MNNVDRRQPAAPQAVLEYQDGDFRVVCPGTFVLCAVSGEAISLDELRYWNVDLQEAYASPEAKLVRLGITKGTPKTS